jgi:gluconolactonase
MKLLLYILIFICPAFLLAQAPVESYPLDSASVAHPGVPKGEVLHFTFEQSKIFPGTFRDYWVYIPAQYNPAKPAYAFIDQDNIQFKAPVVFDNLKRGTESHKAGFSVLYVLHKAHK